MLGVAERSEALLHLVSFFEYSWKYLSKQISSKAFSVLTKYMNGAINFISFCHTWCRLCIFWSSVFNSLLILLQWIYQKSRPNYYLIYLLESRLLEQSQTSKTPSPYLRFLSLSVQYAWVSWSLSHPYAFIRESGSRAPFGGMMVSWQSQALNKAKRGQLLACLRWYGTLYTNVLLSLGWSMLRRKQ